METLLALDPVGDVERDTAHPDHLAVLDYRLAVRRDPLLSPVGRFDPDLHIERLTLLVQSVDSLLCLLAVLGVTALDDVREGRFRPGRETEHLQGVVAHGPGPRSKVVLPPPDISDRLRLLQELPVALEFALALPVLGDVLYHAADTDHLAALCLWVTAETDPPCLAVVPDDSRLGVERLAAPECAVESVTDI